MVAPIQYQGEASTLSAWAVLERGSHATEIPFSVASQFQSTTLRAFWDRQPLRHMANGIPTYAVMNTASIPLTFSVTIQAGSERRVSNYRLQPNARRVLTMPQNAESGSLVIEHQGLPGDLVGAGWLEGSGLVAPLPVVDPATLQSSKHHALRVPTTGWLRTWLTLSNPTVRSQTATLSAYDPVSGARLARITQTVGAETVETVSLVTLFGSLGSTRPREVRITVEHPGRPSSLLVSGAKLSRSGQVQSIPFFQDGQAHHNGTYPLLNGSRGSVSTTWLNLGEAPAKVVAQLDWEGGTYTLPEITIAAGASHRLDFAELIRQAKPDLLDRELDSSYQKGFFRWSARGGSAKLLARTEVGPTEGGRFGFNCAGCCLEFPYGAIEPGSATFLVGSSASFVAGEYRNTCSGGLLGPYSATSPVLTVPSPFTWNGFTLGASSPGSGTLSFTATATRYEVISGVCMTFMDIIAGSGTGDLFDFSITASPSQIRPKVTGAGTPTSTTIRITTNPPRSNRAVQFETARHIANSGGHLGHPTPTNTNTSVLGSLSATVGATNSSGVWEVTYTAPQYSGNKTIKAVVDNRNLLSKQVQVNVAIPGLGTMPSGANYEHTGVIAGIHESNWNATTKTRGDLVNIANKYAAEFPGKRLRYNDISLPMGGSFDGNAGTWIIIPNVTGHSEHKLGRNCDISKSGMSAAEIERVTEIIKDNGGSAGPGGIYDHDTHWHTRH